MAMAKHRWLIGGFVAALALAGPASAQTPGPAPAKGGDDQSNSALAPTAIGLGQPKAEDEIVVTGKAEAKPAEIRQQARAITAQSVQYDYPLAKFQSQVCPGIVGMPTAMADIIVDRIRFNAERVGLKTAPLGKCNANVLVIFVRNGHGVIKNLSKSASGLLSNVKFADLKDLQADTGPVHAWVETLVRSRQGDTLVGSNDGDMTKIPTLNVAQSQSHIFLAARIDISKAVVMIDLRAINGMSVVQLADYITMRAFAATNPVKGDAAASTILGLFDPEHPAHPRELTDFDLAYLHTVYDGVDSLNATSKLASITRKLKLVQAQGGSAKEDE